MKEAADLLRRLPLFSAIGPAALDAVAQRTVPRSVPAGTRLFAEGEPCKGLYVVASGRVSVYRASPDGREQVLHVQEAGQPIAEVPLFDGGPYPASAYSRMVAATRAGTSRSEIFSTSRTMRRRRRPRSRMTASAISGLLR